jgi:hypothetical protein
MTTTTTCTCLNCNGTGKLPHYSHIANGDCFACGATGLMKLTDFIGDNSDISLEVEAANGNFYGATIRCRTWTMSECSVGSGANQTTGLYRSWGRDLWARQITDADEARAIWRTAKQNGIKTSLFD